MDIKIKVYSFLVKEKLINFLPVFNNDSCLCVQVKALTVLEKMSIDCKTLTRPHMEAIARTALASKVKYVAILIKNFRTCPSSKYGQ